MKPVRTPWVYRADVREVFPEGVKLAVAKNEKRNFEVVVKKKKKGDGK